MISAPLHSAFDLRRLLPSPGVERSSVPESPIQQRPAFEETMSTGATPQIAELAPPSNGHARGHSRTRGHNRSRQWAQPPSLSLESSNGSPPKPPLPDDAAHSSYSYGHASQPSFSLHTPSPSHSFAHHDHSHSVTSIHHDAAHGNDMKEEVAALSEGRPEQMYVGATP